MAQQVKARALKSDALSLIPGAHPGEGENQLTTLSSHFMRASSHTKYIGECSFKI